MGNMTFVELLKISVVIPIMLVLSVICCAITIERWVFFMKNGRVNGSMLDRIRTFLRAGNYAEAKKEAAKGKGIIAEALLSQVDAMNLPRNERESLVLFYHQKIQSLLQRRLWVFGTLSFICPLVGLWGTVMGVIRSFKDLAISGSGGPTIVAAGISEALVATAAGIAVAILSAILYNWFNIWMKGALSSADIFGQEMIFITSGNQEK